MRTGTRKRKRRLDEEAPGDAGASAGGPDDPSGALAAWLAARGVEWLDAVATTREGVVAGWGCVASAPIPEGAVVCRVPRAACFGARRAHADADPPARDSQARMARLLLRERAAGSGSAWAPLLRVLSAAQCPWTWPASGRCCLAGTELAPVLWAKLVRLDTEYEKLPREFRTGRAEYREVCALVSATINPWFGGSIVPFNCTLNYSSAPPNVRFESDEGGRAVIGRALRTVQAGEELTQEYADSQADLIYRYGFADPAPSAGPGLRGRQRGGPPTGDVVSISVAQVVAGCSDGLLEPRRRAPAEREQLGAEALRLAGALAPCPWDGLGHELTAELAAGGSGTASLVGCCLLMLADDEVLAAASQAAAEAYDDGPRAGAAPAGAKKRRRAALAPEDAAAAALVGAVTAAGEPERRELRSAARGARRGGDPWPALLAVAGRRRGAVARAREAAAAAVRLRLRALDEAEDAAVPSTGTDRPAAAGLMAQHLRSMESRILHDAARVLREGPLC